MRLLDVLCGLQTWLARTGVDAPLRIHSGYRTPKTNKLTEGAALDSRHIVGRAVDISVAGVSNLKLAGMASVLGRGGTGLYPGRNFVHVDTGDERIWIDRPRKKPLEPLLHSVCLQPGKLRCIQLAVIAGHAIFHCESQMLSCRLDVSQLEIGEGEPEVKLGLIVGASDFFARTIPSRA